MLGSVPFELYGSRMSPSAKGILRVHGDSLVLDFQKINPWTWRRSTPREICIPLNQVDSLEFRNQWFLFHVWLRLRVRKLEYFAALPTSDGAEVVLWCKRRYKAISQEFANVITLRLLERAAVDDDAPNRAQV